MNKIAQHKVVKVRVERVLTPLISRKRLCLICRICDSANVTLPICHKGQITAVLPSVLRHPPTRSSLERDKLPSVKPSDGRHISISIHSYGRVVAMKIRCSPSILPAVSTQKNVRSPEAFAKHKAYLPLGLNVCAGHSVSPGTRLLEPMPEMSPALSLPPRCSL